MIHTILIGVSVPEEGRPEGDEDGIGGVEDGVVLCESKGDEESKEGSLHVNIIFDKKKTHQCSIIIIQMVLLSIAGIYNDKRLFNPNCSSYNCRSLSLSISGCPICPILTNFLVVIL